jgi:hypothetical protein
MDSPNESFVNRIQPGELSWVEGALFIASVSFIQLVGISGKQALCAVA